MLVKDFINAYYGKMHYIVYEMDSDCNAENLFTSDNKDFILSLIGNRNLVRWDFEIFGNNPTLVYFHVYVEKPEEMMVFDPEQKKVSFLKEKIEAWKEKRKVELEEQRNQRFLESLNDIPDPSEYDSHDLRNLPTTKAVINPLRKAGIMSIGQLRTKTVKDLLKIPRISKGRVKEIEDALYSYGLKLKD